MLTEQPAHTRDQGRGKRQGPHQEQVLAAPITFLGMGGPHGTWSGGGLDEAGVDGRSESNWGRHFCTICLAEIRFAGHTQRPSLLFMFDRSANAIKKS